MRSMTALGGLLSALLIACGGGAPVSSGSAPPEEPRTRPDEPEPSPPATVVGVRDEPEDACPQARPSDLVIPVAPTFALEVAGFPAASADGRYVAFEDGFAVVVWDARRRRARRVRVAGAGEEDEAQITRRLRQAERALARYDLQSLIPVAGTYPEEGVDHGSGLFAGEPGDGDLEGLRHTLRAFEECELRWCYEHSAVTAERAPFFPWDGGPEGSEGPLDCTLDDEGADVQLWVDRAQQNVFVQMSFEVVQDYCGMPDGFEEHYWLPLNASNCAE